MRDYRIIILLGLLLFGCKSASVVTSTYQEDLSMWRPQLAQEEPVDTTKSEQTLIATPSQENVAFANHIGTDLDSINRIIAQRNLQRKYWDGYTIQVYTGPSRDKANQSRRQIEVLFEDLRPTVSYFQPNYKVRVGQYYDRLQAYQAYTKVKAAFPRALLLPDKIQIPQNE
ncbi:MAG: SPOR domain-containing protein [Cyclobacteriaceae bacterium]|nr:SPOR domain-containing protein [Cyclobacteriaceae bacterium HetDA_MAG_MS6]